jgi:L-ribulose-5-phosphate 3-epimerase
MAYDVFYEPSDEETRANFMEGLHLGTQWAGQAGVMLGLENLDTPFVENLSDALALIHAINSPWLRLYPDIGNLAAAGYNPPDELRLAKEQVLGIHVKDALPKIIRGVQYGEGIVPFAETFRALAEIGFWGMLGAEMWASMHADVDPVENAAAARRFIASLVETTWPDGKPAARAQAEEKLS